VQWRSWNQNYWMKRIVVFLKSMLQLTNLPNIWMSCSWTQILPGCVISYTQKIGGDGRSKLRTLPWMVTESIFTESSSPLLIKGISNWNFYIFLCLKEFTNNLFRLNYNWPIHASNLTINESLALYFGNL
jgi:hypothetical protein